MALVDRRVGRQAVEVAAAAEVGEPAALGTAHHQPDALVVVGPEALLGGPDALVVGAPGVEAMYARDQLLDVLPEQSLWTGDREMRAIDTMLIVPSQDLRMIAEKHRAELPFAIRALLRSVGGNSPGENKLLSFLLFERAYCQQALCAPSRASILTGMRPASTKIHQITRPVRELIPDAHTLPQHFREAGYHTVTIGKIYHHRGDDPVAKAKTDLYFNGLFRGG